MIALIISYRKAVFLALVFDFFQLLFLFHSWPMFHIHIQIFILYSVNRLTYANGYWMLHRTYILVINPDLTKTYDHFYTLPNSI